MKKTETQKHAAWIIGFSICIASSSLLGAELENRPGEAAATQEAKPGSGTVNRVLSLDGQSGYMRVADSPALHRFTNALTLEAWVKVSTFYAGDGTVNSILRKNLEAGSENFFLRFRMFKGKPLLEMRPGNRGEVLQTPCEVSPGKWYHVAGTWDGSTLTALVNGVKVWSESASGGMSIDQSDLFIGKGDPKWSFGEYFHGAIDEIRIWNVARSAGQIQAAMTKPLTGKEPGLVAGWNFDDGSARDLTGQGSDGLLEGGARIVEAPRAASPEPK